MWCGRTPQESNNKQFIYQIKKKNRQESKGKEGNTYAHVYPLWYIGIYRHPLCKGQRGKGGGYKSTNLRFGLKGVSLHVRLPRQ